MERNDTRSAEAVLRRMKMESKSVGISDALNKALWAAASTGSCVCAQLALDAGADVTAPGKLGAPPLLAAVRWGDVETVTCVAAAAKARQALDAPYAAAGGRTALQAAVHDAGPDVVAALARAGASVNARDPQSHDTPLHTAVRAGDAVMAELLLELGADATLCATDARGSTPLHLAAAAGELEVMRSLLRCADPNVVSGDGTHSVLATAVSAAAPAMVAVVLSHPRVDTGFIHPTSHEALLHMALRRRDRDGEAIVELLLRRGAGSAKSHVDGEGKAPLHAAAADPRSVGALRMLLGADCEIEQRNAAGATALFVAAAAGNAEGVSALLDAGARAAVPALRDTLLHVAAAASNESSAAATLARCLTACVKPSTETPVPSTAPAAPAEQRALTLVRTTTAASMQPPVPLTVDALSAESVTALTVAAALGRRDCVRVLLAHGADAGGGGGEATPLAAACLGGHAAVAMALLDAGAGINQRSHRLTGWPSQGGPLVRAAVPPGMGATPLHAAAVRGHAAIVELLLARGADPAAATTSGATAEQCARGTEQGDALAAVIERAQVGTSGGSTRQ
jgi:ankyrin repeat protein